MINIDALKDHIFDVVGALRAVHKELGPGLNEYCYQEGLMLQLKKDKIDFIKEMSFHPSYMGETMQAEFRIDFLCKNDIVVECKAVQKLTSEHRAQLFNYMREPLLSTKAILTSQDMLFFLDGWKRKIRRKNVTIQVNRK